MNNIPIPIGLAGKLEIVKVRFFSRVFRRGANRYGSFNKRIWIWKGYKRMLAWDPNEVHRFLTDLKKSV